MDPAALVEQHYDSLYRFALSLARDESTAWDLTQQTYYVWATKGHQLRDPAKVKTWLFTTLYHEFLATRRHRERFVSETISDAERPPAQSEPESTPPLDSAAVHEALQALKEEYRAVLMLFYLKANSYKEIAEILGIPIGTVMSRLSRGKEELRKRLRDPAPQRPPQEEQP